MTTPVQVGSEVTSVPQIAFIEASNADSPYGELIVNYSTPKMPSVAAAAQLSLLTNYNATEQCTGIIFIPGRGTTNGSVPLVDCVNQTQVNEIFGSSSSSLQWPCTIVFNNDTGSCDIVTGTNSTVPNVFTVMPDSGLPQVVYQTQVHAERLTMGEDDTATIFRTTLIAVSVSLSIILICVITFCWWRFSRHSPAEQETSESSSRRRKLKSIEIDRFETFVFVGPTSSGSIRSHNPSDEADDTETCAVCLEEYEPGDIIRKLWCGHQFHRKCADRWLKNRNTTCPLCRADFPKPETTEMTEQTGPPQPPIGA